MKTYTLFLALFLALPTAQAELFRWVDADGSVTYQDRPPPAEVKAASKVKLRGIGGPSRKQMPPVMLYRTPDCASCDSAAQFLTSLKIPVTEVDVSTDLDNQKALKEKSGSLSVPTIVLAEKVMKGFTPSWLKSELESAGYIKTKKAAENAGQNEDEAADEESPDTAQTE
ncbi:MAG: hypothetical protein DSZ32_05975 [Gammaproteobacteria bacterium]|nr:MAG: hypothetical protein DSZ32_05975 [Gammaproteobacteria bacterium]